MKKSVYSTQRVKNFKDKIIEPIAEIMKETLSPDDVFDVDELADWAKENTKDHWEPSDIFPSSELAQWAEDNGFSRP